jgi:hypothetical protein
LETLIQIQVDNEMSEEGTVWGNKNWKWNTVFQLL